MPALLLAHHLERELVVVAEEEAPLAGRRDLRGVQEDVGDGPAVGVADGEEDARHEREVEGHVELVAVTEIGAHVRRPLVRLGQQDPPFVVRVHPGADLLEVGVRLRQVLAARPRPLVEIGHGVAPEAVEALVEPEGHDAEHLRLDGGIVVVQIGLVVEEAVPVVGLGHRVPGPVWTAPRRRR